MKYLKITLVSVFLSFNLFSQDIEIIELHSSTVDEVKKQNEIQQEESSDDIMFTNENIESEGNNTIENLENDGNNTNENLEINEENLDVTNIIKRGTENQNNENSSIIVSMLNFWENSKKNDLDYLFNNINSLTSKVMTSYFVDSLTEISKAPQLYNQAEFDNLRIKTLIKIERMEEALRVLNNIATYETYKNYYDRIKLDFYLTSNKLSEACGFKSSLQDSNEDQNNIILKLSIFCSFLENKLEEADLLNSLLLDTKDKDEYFQKMYFNLKNEINEPIDIAQMSFDKSSLALYSAMIRIGGLPFTEKFLEFDSTNLTLPIILSPSTEISLRLKSAHKAYELELFNAESLSALYQSVDFSSDELNNWKESLENNIQKPEMGMALLFQNARVQLLPITRLESLKEFWSYANIHGFEKLAYAVSRNLIESTEPSIELSEYSILLARAHIFNKNFRQAEKWILFVENYVLQSNELDQKDLDSVKFLYSLQKSEDKDTFINNVEDNLISKIDKEGTLDGYTENLKTIFTIILKEKNIIDKIKDERKIIDERLMPSSYIINTIINSSENNRVGELILTALVSLQGKSWNDIHPQHLKILLESFKRAKLDNLLKNVIIEIFEESKII